MVRDLTVRDIRTIIEELLEDTKKHSSEKSKLISLKLMRGRYKNMPDGEKPFAIRITGARSPLPEIGIDREFRGTCQIRFNLWFRQKTFLICSKMRTD